MVKNLKDILQRAEARSVRELSTLGMPEVMLHEAFYGLGFHPQAKDHLRHEYPCNKRLQPLHTPVRLFIDVNESLGQENPERGAIGVLEIVSNEDILSRSAIANEYLFLLLALVARLFCLLTHSIFLSLSS